MISSPAATGKPHLAKHLHLSHFPLRPEQWSLMMNSLQLASVFSSHMPENKLYTVLEIQQDVSKLFSLYLISIISQESQQSTALCAYYMIMKI